MMAAILNSTMLDSDTAILDSDTFLSSLRFTQKTLTPLWLWLKLIQSDSNLFILTQLIDGSHLEFGHLGFSHLSFSSQTHSHLPGLVPTICTKNTSLPTSLPTICTKKTSLIHSDSTWWWQPSWILPCWIQTPCFLLSDSLKNTFTPLWLLTQTNLIWLKLIHCHSTWWWQPSWILPCWIQTVPSWIQTPSYLLSDSLKNTLPPLWLLTQTNSIWLKLIHSDSTWWWQPSWILPCWIQTLRSWIQTLSYLLSD